jgi:hypothetical protein
MTRRPTIVLRAEGMVIGLPLGPDDTLRVSGRTCAERAGGPLHARVVPASTSARTTLIKYKDLNGIATVPASLYKPDATLPEVVSSDPVLKTTLGSDQQGGVLAPDL